MNRHISAFQNGLICNFTIVYDTILLFCKNLNTLLQHLCDQFEQEKSTKFVETVLYLHIFDFFYIHLIRVWEKNEQR